MTSKTGALGVSTLAAFAFCLLTASPAMATGPIGTCASGVPMLWAGGAANVPFNPDQGDLGPVDHAAAVAAVQAAFDVWGAVSTSTASYTNAGELPVDVDITNFDPFLNPTAPDGLSAIVFDDTGEIFDLLFGPGSGVLGFAGPEWIETATCTVIEGVSFLNGPSFDDAQAASDVMVHEFGHYSGLGHTQVNGFNLLGGDPTGPAPGPGFGDSPLTEIETMYPFYFGPTSGTSSLEKDDESGIAALYPEATFAATTGTIAGTIFAPKGMVPVTGINVIARNPADPFNDAVSALSGDYSFTSSSDDPVAGQYTLRGLTPGVNYVVYVDGIGPGGFSTQPRSLPGAEEFHNGANESNDPTVDDPQVSVPVFSVAGSPSAGIDVVFNLIPPGPIVLGDDSSVEIFPDQSFNFCGTVYSSFFVNSNGSVSFGASDTSFAETDQDFLIGPPRIAGLWDDLNPGVGGAVSWNQTATNIEVSFENVPEFGAAAGSNTFKVSMIPLQPLSLFTVTWGAMTATDGLAGYSCGGRDTSSYETQSDLRDTSFVVGLQKAAVYQRFVPAGSPNDLDNHSVFFIAPPLPLQDLIESGNDPQTDSHQITLPFSSLNLQTRIDPPGNDVDFYRFQANVGDIIVAELVPGNPGTDMVLGLLRKVGSDFVVLVTNDDGGAGLLSRFAVEIGESGTYHLGVSTFPDFDFSGDGGDFGRYVLSVVKYRGDLLDPGDDDFTEVPLGFSFPFQGGSWTSTFVNSNGNLTFGAGSTDFSETVAEFLAGPPRIAPLWSDLSPQFGFIITEPSPNTMIVHYASVPEFFDDRPNYFSVELKKSGRVRSGWLASSRGSSIVGVTEGNGAADPGPSDLSSSPTWPVSGTTYEPFTGGAVPFFFGAQFSNFDLFFKILTFTP